MKLLNLHRYTTTPAQDMLLLQRILNGEKQLFELLLRPYDQRLQETLATILQNPDAAAKSIVRSYLRAFVTLYQFDGRNSFPAWLFAISLEEVRKEYELTANGRPAIPLPWLCYVLKEHGRLRKSEIAFCLAISCEKVNRNLALARIHFRDKLLARSRAITQPQGHPLAKQIFQLCASTDVQDQFLRLQLNAVTTARLKENETSESYSNMNIEKEHRENLMLCTYIRLGFIRGIEMYRIKKYTDWYWQNHLLSHFRQEEAIVFPLLGMHHDLVRKALAQHRRLKRLFESADDLNKVLNRIEEELLAHVRFEEKVLFREIQKSDDENSWRKIAALHQASPSEDQWQDQFWK